MKNIWLFLFRFHSQRLMPLKPQWHRLLPAKEREKSVKRWTHRSLWRLTLHTARKCRTCSVRWDFYFLLLNKICSILTGLSTFHPKLLGECVSVTLYVPQWWHYVVMYKCAGVLPSSGQMVLTSHCLMFVIITIWLLFTSRQTDVTFTQNCKRWLTITLDLQFTIGQCTPSRMSSTSSWWPLLCA